MIKNETEQDVVAPGAIEPFFQPELRKLSFWKDFIAFNQKIQNKAKENHKNVWQKRPNTIFWIIWNRDANGVIP